MGLFAGGTRRSTPHQLAKTFNVGRITPQTWFITGCSNDLGHQLSERFPAPGHRVAATPRQPTALDGLKARYDDALRVETPDVTDTPAIRRVVAKVFSWTVTGRGGWESRRFAVSTARRLFAFSYVYPRQ